MIGSGGGSDDDDAGLTDAREAEAYRGLTSPEALMVDRLMRLCHKISSLPKKTDVKGRLGDFWETWMYSSYSSCSV